MFVRVIVKENEKQVVKTTNSNKEIYYVECR
jgi:hypothetical protein